MREIQTLGHSITPPNLIRSQATGSLHQLAEVFDFCAAASLRLKPVTEVIIAAIRAMLSGHCELQAARGMIPVNSCSQDKGRAIHDGSVDESMIVHC